MAVKNNRPKFWNMVSVDDTCGEIILYGDIERRTPIDWFTGMPLEENVITPQGFQRQKGNKGSNQFRRR